MAFHWADPNEDNVRSQSIWGQYCFNQKKKLWMNVHDNNHETIHLYIFFLKVKHFGR